MTREEYIKEFMKFTTQEQQEILRALLPNFCQNMMSNPAQMQEMMQMCSSMMGGSFKAGEWKIPPFWKGANR